MDRWNHTACIQVGKLIYGTRTTDPPAGCVFLAERDGRGYAVLHSFGGRRGYGPDGLVLVDDVLYGVTTWGGSDHRRRPDGNPPGYGVLYRLNLDGSGFEVLHEFSPTDGRWPRGTLAYVGGMLYGMTAETLFRIRPEGGGFETVHAFGPTDGPGFLKGRSTPGGGLMVSDGVLYGVSFAGGRDRQGTVFRFDTVLELFETLHHFKGPEGRQPLGALLLYNGMLHGVTNAGGRHDAGVVFQMPAAGGPLRTLVEFDRPEAAGRAAGLALGLSGAPYETRAQGPRGNAVAFRLAEL